MAFLRKVQSLVKQAVPSPLVHNAIRCMSTSTSRLFIGGLSYATDEQSLKEAFSSYGEVVEARVIMDRETGRSRGFGFVSFTSTDEASSAVSGMDGKDLHGRLLRVSYAQDRPSGPRGGYDRGYAGGSFVDRSNGSGGYGGRSTTNYGGRAGGGGYGGGGDGGYGDRFSDRGSYGGGSFANTGEDLGNAAGGFSNMDEFANTSGSFDDGFSADHANTTALGDNLDNLGSDERSDDDNTNDHENKKL